MTTAISGPTVAPVALQFDPISPAATFPRVARLARGRHTGVPEGPFGTLLRRVELPASALTSTAYPPRLRLTPHAHTAAFLASMKNVRLAAIVFALVFATVSHPLLADTTGSAHELAGLWTAKK